jgi:hypothetical protein
VKQRNDAWIPPSKSTTRCVAMARGDRERRI